MKRRPPATPQGDLFGAAREAERDPTPVSLPMREISKGTGLAWHLAPIGVGSEAAGFAPRSLVKRGEGPRAHEFTMPRFVALERGWL